MKITFEPPLKHETEDRKVETCAEIVLREPTGGEIIRAEKAHAAENGAHASRVRDSVLIAEVSGTSIDLVRKMPASKFKAAASFLNSFDEPPGPDDKPDADPELVLQLPSRIEVMGRIVDQIELREPTTGEVQEAQRQLKDRTPASMRAMQQHLICLVSDYPRTVIERVPVGILNRASRYLLGFI